MFDLFWVLFLMSCVRVTSEREVGYRVLTEGITGSKVSKMKPRVGKLNSRQTTGG